MGDAEIVATAEVPAERLLPCPHPFAAPPADEVASLFARAHQSSEAIYNGDGSWGHGFVHDESTARWRALFAAPEDYVDWPTVRDTARRLAAYAWALDVRPHLQYQNRLAAGVDWLLKQQLPDGSFPWWVSRTGMVETDHLYYKNGYAAVGLLEAHRHLPDARIPRAVRRAADWTAAWRVSPNNNYNSLACWALMACYRHDPDPRYLQASLHKTREGVLPGQLPNGGWTGHNSWVYYQGIIVSGLAMLLAALPAQHPERPELAACLMRSLNNLLLRQAADGRLLATFDADELAEANRRRIGYERGPQYLADPHALLGLLWAHDLLGLGELRGAIRGLLAAYAAEMAVKEPEGSPGTHGEDIMMLGYAWRWLVRGERSGAGG